MSANTTRATTLEMAALLLRLQPGDEVIVPAFTFVSTASAFMLYGAKPVFVDINPTTLNIDENERFIKNVNKNYRLKHNTKIQKINILFKKQ